MSKLKPSASFPGCYSLTAPRTWLGAYLAPSGSDNKQSGLAWVTLWSPRQSQWKLTITAFWIYLGTVQFWLRSLTSSDLALFLSFPRTISWLLISHSFIWNLTISPPIVTTSVSLSSSACHLKRHISLGGRRQNGPIWPLTGCVMGTAESLYGLQFSYLFSGNSHFFQGTRPSDSLRFH